MSKEPVVLSEEQKRYYVTCGELAVYIVDKKRIDKPYPISYENTQGQNIRESSIKCAEQWCHVWNLVENGYCGSCEVLISSTKDKHFYPAVGWNSLYKKICFYCACSQED